MIFRRFVDRLIDGKIITIPVFSQLMPKNTVVPRFIAPTRK